MYILIKTREYAKTNCHTCDHDGHKTTKSIYYNYEYTYAYALGNDFRVYYFCYHIVQRNAYFCLAIFTFENNFCIFIQKRSALVTTTPINLHFYSKNDRVYNWASFVGQYIRLWPIWLQLPHLLDWHYLVFSVASCKGMCFSSFITPSF